MNLLEKINSLNQRLNESTGVSDEKIQEILSDLKYALRRKYRGSAWDAPFQTGAWWTIGVRDWGSWGYDDYGDKVMDDEDYAKSQRIFADVLRQSGVADKLQTDSEHGEKEWAYFKLKSKVPYTPPPRQPVRQQARPARTGNRDIFMSGKDFDQLYNIDQDKYFQTSSDYIASVVLVLKSKLRGYAVRYWEDGDLILVTHRNSDKGFSMDLVNYYGLNESIHWRLLKSKDLGIGGEHQYHKYGKYKSKFDLYKPEVVAKYVVPIIKKELK
jgi:hypothetical protein